MRKTALGLVALLSLSLLVVSFAGCSSSSDQAGFQLRAASDLLLLAQAAQAEFAAATHIELEAQGTDPSRFSIEDLRQGEFEALLLGREPAPEELEGLEDHLIAHDAVCVLIDENSSVGGEWRAGPVPSHKTDGLRALSVSDLKAIFSFWKLAPEERWTWSGGYYGWDYIEECGGDEWAGYDFEDDPRRELSSSTIAHGSRTYCWFNVKDPNATLSREKYEMGWVRQPLAVFPSFLLPAGEFDTQTALFEKLDLNEQEIATAGAGSLVSPDLNTEEEVLSFQYREGPPHAAGGSDFVFKLGFASRRVTSKALERLPISVVPVDGIDPIEDPGSIYDGRYPLSREIHILTQENPSPEVDELVEFLLSEGGQQVLENAGYLPLHRQ